MLPRHPLLGAEPLHSLRAGTTFDPRTMTLRVGRHETGALLADPAGGPDQVMRATLDDDSLITRIHEGIHWRQFVGTSVGAFLIWLRHAREREFFAKLHDLPPARRRALLDARRAGRPVLALTDDGMPDPPIVLGRPPDAVEMLRCVFFDGFTLETLFLDPTPLARPHAPLDEILSATIADAATELARHHPRWAAPGYAEIQNAFRLPETEIGRLRIDDAQAEAGTHELTTRDLLEAGAIANELVLATMTREQRYHSPGTEAISVWTPEAAPDPERFRAEASRFLRSAHGVAARHLFALARFDAELPYAWLSLAAACDFALNPPLPPLAPPPQAPRPWKDLYPPLRFTLAARAMRRIGGVDEPTHAALARFHAALADATGLSAPPAPADADFPPLPDFPAIVAEGREAELSEGSLTHYDFLVWAEAHHARKRSTELPKLVTPGWFAHERFAARDLEGLWRTFHGLGVSAPIEADADDGFRHAAGSTPAFGTWFAASSLAHGLAQDLMFGVGAADALGLPRELVEDARVRRHVRRAVVEAVGEDPWA